MNQFKFDRVSNVLKKISIFLLASFLLASCGGAGETQTQVPASPTNDAVQAPVEPLTVAGVKISGTLGSEPQIEIVQLGESVTQLVIADQAIGQGQSVRTGSRVLAHYVGYGLITGAKFDSSWDRGQPIEFGLDQVIAGWSQGVPGMKNGGRRVLVIPAELAYGQNPPPGSGIEPGEPLLFVIDLFDFI